MRPRRNFVLDARTATSRFPGIGRYVRCLAEAMGPGLERGERLWILNNPGSDLPLGEGEGRSADRVRWTPVPLSPFAIRAQWEIPRQLRRLGADVYHSTYFVMPYFAGVRSVLTIYDLIPQRRGGTVTPRARLLAPLLTRLALRRVDHVVAVSEATHSELLAADASLRLRSSVVPLAAAPQFEPQPAKAVDRIRRKFALPDRFLLYVGSNRPHKNLLRLMEAWLQVASTAEADAVELILAGPWDERYAQARRFARGNSMSPTTRFLGAVEESDLPGLYGAATAFVFPSLDEGFGLPVIEAMASGLPVLCSSIPSLTEIAGDAVLYFDPSSTVGMAGQIRRCLADPSMRTELSEKGRAAAKRFSWTQAAQRTLEIYRLLVAQRTR